MTYEDDRTLILTTLAFLVANSKWHNPRAPTGDERADSKAQMEDWTAWNLAQTELMARFAEVMVEVKWGLDNLHPGSHSH